MNYEAQNIVPLTTGETNLMQIHLITASGKDPGEWIEENSARVREIINQHPEIADLYRRDPQKAEAFIKAELERGSGEN